MSITHRFTEVNGIKIHIAESARTRPLSLPAAPAPTAPGAVPKRWRNPRAKCV